MSLEDIASKSVIEFKTSFLFLSSATYQKMREVALLCCRFFRSSDATFVSDGARNLSKQNVSSQTTFEKREKRPAIFLFSRENPRIRTSKWPHNLPGRRMSAGRRRSSRPAPCLSSLSQSKTTHRYKFIPKLTQPDLQKTIQYSPDQESNNM